ncbi:MAG: molybdopterin-binding protein [Chloroflexota bacterium]
MPEFLKLLPPLDALDKLLLELSLSSNIESIDVSLSLGRVTANAITAPYALPSFPRSTVDGYAVMAADTHGANSSLPVYLNQIGEVLMGAQPDFSLSGQQCALIHTGGMLPEGANAIVMVEDTQIAKNDEIEINRAVAAGGNVLQIGEDVNAGDIVIPKGARLRPAEIGGLMALGITELQVTKKPKVAIISSGDEVISPYEEKIAIGQVRDVNTFTLQALINQNGGQPYSYGIVPDEYNSMLKVVERAVDECDLVIITAGSSASARDLTSKVIDQLGPPGVLVHGVNVRPGKPTILGMCKDTPVIGLPGNPVSALVIATIFVVPVIEKLSGVAMEFQRAEIRATLSLNLSSQTGREDWVPVGLIETEDGVQANPIFGKSNLIFTLAKAHGLITIPADVNGLSAGETVSVSLMR